MMVVMRGLLVITTSVVDQINDNDDMDDNETLMVTSEIKGMLVVMTLIMIIVIDTVMIINVETTYFKLGNLT